MRRRIPWSTARRAWRVPMINARHSRAGGNPALFLAVALLLSACTLGPDYKRPEVDLPATLGVAQSAKAPAERWWSLFGDPVLDALVDEGLANNRDLRAAAERIEQSRAQLGIIRAAQFPSAGVEATRSRDRASALG